jgi:inositol-phosphate phosphatase / L-galactose 1-phosphate phosphatase / histidinol-phosphatase
MRLAARGRMAFPAPGWHEAGMSQTDDLALAHALADAAGAAIRPYFRAPCRIDDKADASPVTEADQAAERAMRALIAQAFPADGIIGEEYGVTNAGAGRQWVLDPIDGTRSFIAGRPIFGTLIALMQDGWPVLGIIDQPVTGERWVGAMGQATTLNGRAVRTRGCTGLDQAILASTGPQFLAGHTAEPFAHLGAHCRDTVWGGDCYNYALLATGHVDIVVESGLKLYDLAALVPVVEGAGGRMCDWAGEPLTDASDGRVIALGDPARLDDVLEALAGHGHGH